MKSLKKFFLVFSHLLHYLLVLLLAPTMKRNLLNALLSMLEQGLELIQMALPAHVQFVQVFTTITSIKSI
ncbi:hypothetical protein [Treponema zioleckii]|uniref:hypothetical protein n=1 Tax=Treponema zioleckii TaxID=331680 RepID=UPI00168A9285|nr:hypothetical protein [Treponema zioleckii]